MATLGFIGTGNMGGALARAACKSVPSDQVFLSNRTVEKARALAAELDCRVTDNEAIAQNADLIFLGVKPQYMAEVMAEICPILEARESRFLLVSMAAGLTIPRIRELAGKNYPVIRIMPNTPSAIGEGMVFFILMQRAGGSPDAGQDLLQVYAPCAIYVLVALFSLGVAALSRRKLRQDKAAKAAAKTAKAAEKAAPKTDEEA